MRAIAAMLMLSVTACSAIPASDVELVNIKPDAQGTTCSFKQHPKLSIFDAKELMPGSGRGAHIAIWSDPAPVIVAGPPATLSVTFNKPAGAGDPWMITLSVDPGTALPGFTDVARGQLWVDNIPAPRKMMVFDDPVAHARVLSGDMDDTWNQHLLTGREAVVKAYDKAGRLLAHYRWDLKPLAAARPLLDRVKWSCVKPAW